MVSLFQNWINRSRSRDCCFSSYSFILFLSSSIFFLLFLFVREYDAFEDENNQCTKLSLEHRVSKIEMNVWKKTE